jgi:hypothetical protein
MDNMVHLLPTIRQQDQAEAILIMLIRHKHKSHFIFTKIKHNMLSLHNTAGTPRQGSKFRSNMHHHHRLNGEEGH